MLRRKPGMDTRLPSDRRRIANGGEGIAGDERLYRRKGGMIRFFGSAEPETPAPCVKQKKAYNAAAGRGFSGG